MTNSLVLAVQARANLITRVGDDFLSLISQREFSEHLAGVGSGSNSNTRRLMMRLTPT